MQRARRTVSEPRLELTPLMDMMFLLLTFFIFAFALIVRVELSQIRLPGTASGRPAEPASRITVSLTETGEVRLDGRPVTLDRLGVELEQAARAAGAPEAPGTPAPRPSSTGAGADDPLTPGPARPVLQLVIAADERAPSGALFALMDALQQAGHADLKFLRLPKVSAAPQSAPAPSSGPPPAPGAPASPDPGG